MLFGLTRVRDEGLIFEDTLNHYLKFCGKIIVYDDCSTDNTVEIARSFDRVEVVQGHKWLKNRRAEETRHRALLLDLARAKKADWCLYFDADERLEGELPNGKGATGYRFRLFDAYLTPGWKPYQGGELAKLPRMFGPEYRDILFMFRTGFSAFKGMDRREPIVHGPVLQAGVRVKHYGKGISLDQWEQTCDYYTTHFPEPYVSKWEARKGHAIHDRSDFGKELYPWSELHKYEVPLK